MRRYLPICFLVVCFFFLSSFFSHTFAQAAVPAQAGSITPPPDGSWVQDSDVTFTGKAGARAGQFLDWTLQNYDWVCVTKTDSGCDNANNPIQSFWIVIRNIVYAFFAIIVLITAFLLIITRGKSITLRKFVPRFIIMVLLVFFSFALIQFLYQIFDIIQGFFLRNPDAAIASQHPYISQQNLLYIGFDYENFTGFKLFGIQYEESAFISLLLVKLTAFTYYVMTGILLIRKIILWFFIVISPIFPLLLLYSPIRNTGKIWIGEFFRWLLYAPLFAIFLSGLVNIWRAGIPLPFKFGSDIVYPTAISIILGGPGQQISMTNSVNNANTFAQYVVALLMLWVVIILPFLLLQIFLDYIKSLSVNDTAWLRQIATTGSSFIGPSPKTPSPTPPFLSGSTGMAKQIPFISKIAIPNSLTKDTTFSQVNTQNLKTAMNTEILKLTSLQVPTMRDIASYETAMLSKDISSHQKAAQVHESLERIAKPTQISTTDKGRYETIRKTLVEEGQKGNPLATSILNAANVVAKTAGVTTSDIGRLSSVLQKSMNVDQVSSVDRQKYQTIHTQLVESQSSDPLAQALLSATKNNQITEELVKKLLDAKEKGSNLASIILRAAGIASTNASFIPVVNRVQQVSLDDYEAVKKMWRENYKKIDPPKDVAGKQEPRSQWLKNETTKITDTITLLLSSDPKKATKGMEEVGAILPFLLIGGFSKSEIIAYLKAKFEAAKETLETLEAKNEEETTLLETEKKTGEKPKELHAEASEKENENGQKHLPDES